jgi:hypothetical protein
VWLDGENLQTAIMNTPKKFEAELVKMNDRQKENPDGLAVDGFIATIVPDSRSKTRRESSVTRDAKKKNPS